MPPAPKPEKEDERLLELLKYQILDTGADSSFDNITKLAQQAFNTPIAIVSLVDDNRQWFKSCIGLDVSETPRDYAFCGYTILSETPLVIEDASKDQRVSDNPLVTGGPQIRFYAGVPLKNSAGHSLGSLCVIDQKPYSPTEQQLETLTLLGQIVVAQMEAHKTAVQLKQEKAETERILAGRNLFFATMSHEIRTPITAIMGLAEILGDEECDSPFDNKQAARMVLSNSRYLLDVINNILDVSKADSGKLTIERIQCSVFEILRAVESMVELKAQEKDLAFHVEYHYPLPKKMTSDPTRLKQVLINLANNAIKFTDTGSVRIQVNFDTDEHMLHFAVIDSGIGISEEEQRSLFQPFQQANTSITRRFGGTGLGLSISKTIVEKLGGTISVESSTGNGATFSLSIPLDTQLAIELVEHNPIRQLLSQNDRATRFSGKVLVVEDEPVNQRLIAHLLTRMGFEVETACTGESGVEKATTGEFDLILMDMHLPGIDGLAATQQIKKNQITAPIVALTASTNRDSISALLEAGCAEFVPKPFQRGDLIETLRRYFVNQKTPSTEAVANAIAASALPEDNSFAALVIDYARSMGDRVQLIEDAYANEDWQVLREAAHRLVGAGLFGFPKISLVSKLLEEQAERKSKSDCAELLDRLKAETAKMCGE